MPYDYCVAIKNEVVFYGQTQSSGYITKCK